MKDHRSFPEAADGRPALPMEAELWAAGCDLETARFVARQLGNQGYTLARADLHEAALAERDRQLAEVRDALVRIAGKKKYADDPWTIARAALEAIDHLNEPPK